MKPFILNGVLLGSAETLERRERAGKSYYVLFFATDRTHGDIPTVVYLDEHGEPHTRAQADFDRKYRPTRYRNPIEGVFADRRWYVWKDEEDIVHVYNRERGLSRWTDPTTVDYQVKMTPHLWSKARTLVKEGKAALIECATGPDYPTCLSWLSMVDTVRKGQELA